MEDRKELIKKLIAENRYRDEVRNALVSEGFGSAGFEDEYESLLTEAGVSEPKRRDRSRRVAPVPKGVMKVAVTRSALGLGTVFLLILLASAAWAAFSFFNQPAPVAPIQWGTPSADEELTGGESAFTEVVVRSKVETTAASARLFGGRMGSYDGVCEDISVVPPVECAGDDTFFMIYAILPKEGWYCVDNTGFKGVVARPSSTSCQ